ncbi:hypothetical protein POTOM_059878 [Populus tomentosa]|uniref:C3H1-type domain-containing protein n=1 Tax=Populus tomentosa TaxID=118781 RepID=A0A8X7XRB8_POPTO|nr:hypothetical protein POTOM_059878 [Populus tomentosa]
MQELHNLEVVSTDEEAFKLNNNMATSSIREDHNMGEPLCIFYSRYGICKFGPSCKFDHPMGVFTYNLTASSSADAPVRRLLGSSSGSAGLTLSSEGLVEAGPTKPRRLSLSEPRQMPPGDDNIDTGG